MKKSLTILLSIFVATVVIGLGFRIALALNYIDFSGADTQDIRWPAGQTLSFVQGGSERLRIDATTGNIVINQNLTVTGSVSSSGGQSFGGTLSAPAYYDSDNTAYYADPAGTSVLNWATFAGNVGIGTTGPNATLAVTNTGSGNSFLVEDSASPDSTPFVINASGQVGFGGATPVFPVDFFSQATFRDNTYFGVSQKVTIGNGDGTYGQLAVTDATQTLRLSALGASSVQTWTNGSARMTVDSNGNVGIGTTSPHSLLEVSSSAPQLHINDVNGTASSDSTGYIVFTHGTTGTAHSSIQMENGLMGFDTAGAGNFAFTGGNVGIGTTNPTNGKLEVNGTIRTHAAITVQSGAGNLIGGLTWASTDNGQLYLQNGGIQTINIIASGNTWFNGGNVGIGTTSPGAKLDIEGNLQMYTGGSWFYMLSQNSRNIYLATAGGGIAIDQSGFVGIGITSPAQKLHIKGGDNTGLRLNASDYGNGYIQMTGRDQNIAGTVSSFYHTIDVKMKTQGDNAGTGVETTIMQLFKEGWSGGDIVAFPRGSVGIGYTDTSGNKLAVNGTIYSTMVNTPSLCIAGDCKTAWSQVGGGAWTLSGNNLYPNSTSYNVGIGTTGPGEKLSVSGGHILLDDGYALKGKKTDGSTKSMIYPSNNQLIVGSAQPDWDRIIISNSANANDLVISSGNVGIGTTVPGGKLDIVGSGSAPNLRVTSSSWGDISNAMAIFDSGASGDGKMVRVKNYGARTDMTMFDVVNNVGTVFAIRGDGNIGIGTTDPGYKLHVVGGDVKIGQSVGDNRKLYFGDGSGVWIGEDADEGLQIYTNYRTAIMGGNVGIGTTDPGYKLEVLSASGNGVLSTVNGSTARAIYGQHNSVTGIGYGVYAYSISTTGFGLWCQAVNNSGGCSGNRAWSGTSDGRLKTNIVTIDNALEKVQKLRGVYFTWKNDSLNRREMGFIAQEALPVTPEVVGKGPEGYYSMTTSQLTAVLVEAVKELASSASGQKDEIAALALRLARNDKEIDNLLAMMGRFTIDENGTLTVKKVVTDELELGGYCVKVVEGTLKTEKGSCNN